MSPAELLQIRAAASAFERMYAGVRYQDIPRADLEAQRQRDITLWNADRSACFAQSPEHGELYDLMSYPTLNTVEQARLNELYWKVFPLDPTREASAASNPLAA